MKKIWKIKNFYQGDSMDGILAGKLADFLNKNDISIFSIVQMQDGYVEIVYQDKNET